MGDTRPAGMPYPEFANPPVIEVACGVKFEALPKFRVAHFGLFWAEVRNDFPRCEHALPMDLDVSSLANLTGIVPRIWLINHADDRLIQMQHNRFLYNWRKRKDDASYPRYATILPPFRTFFETFSRFVEREGLGEIKPQEFELTYVNHIPTGPAAEVASNVSRIVFDMDWLAEKHSFLPEPRVLNWHVAFKLPGDAGTLTAKLNPAKRRGDNADILVLELTARGLYSQGPLSDMWKWFDLAHDWIVFGFKDMTTLEAQRDLWGLNG